MKTYHIKTPLFDEQDMTIKLHAYQDRAYDGERRIAIQIMDKDGQPFMTASTNLVDLPCEVGHTYMKDYSENEGIVQCLVDLGVIEVVHRKMTDPYGTVFPYVKVLIANEPDN